MATVGSWHTPLHDRALAGVQDLYGRGLAHVDGVEKMMVNRAISLLHPRVERKIRSASEDALRQELVYLRNLIDSILDDSPRRARTTAPSPARRHRRERRGRRGTATDQRRSSSR